MRRVLVTGATGFIGRHALPRLVERGFDVQALSRSKRPPVQGVTWHIGTLASESSVHALMDSVRPTHLLHLAWDTTAGSYYTTPRNVEWLQDSLRLCTAFIRAGGRRIIGAGTSAEYDVGVGGDLTEGVTPLVPNGLYGHCKNALQQVLASLCGQVGVQFAWGRVFFCYGPGEDPTRPIPRLAQDILAGRRVPFQEGKGLRDYVHVRDAADAFAILTASDFVGAVNIGSGKGTELRSFVGKLASALGRPDAIDLGALPTPSYEPPQVVASITRMQEFVGWRPAIPLDAGIAETAAYWKAGGQS